MRRTFFETETEKEDGVKHKHDQVQEMEHLKESRNKPHTEAEPNETWGHCWATVKQGVVD